MTQFGRQADLVPGHGAGNAAGNDLHRGRRADRAPGAADVRPAARTCLNGPQSEAAAPPDLLAWLRAQSVADAAQALGLSRRTVYRLQGGYWPADARKVAAASDCGPFRHVRAAGRTSAAPGARSARLPLCKSFPDAPPAP